MFQPGALPESLARDIWCADLDTGYSTLTLPNDICCGVEWCWNWGQASSYLGFQGGKGGGWL